MEARARRTGAVAIGLIVLAWIVATAVAWNDARRVFDNFGNLLSWIVPILTTSALVFLVMSWRLGQDGRAFLFSTLTVIGMAVTVGIALYPNLVPAVDAPLVACLTMAFQISRPASPIVLPPLSLPISVR